MEKEKTIIRVYKNERWIEVWVLEAPEIKIFKVLISDLKEIFKTLFSNLFSKIPNGD